MIIIKEFTHIYNEGEYGDRLEDTIEKFTVNKDGKLESSLGKENKITFDQALKYIDGYGTWFISKIEFEDL